MYVHLSPFFDQRPHSHPASACLSIVVLLLYLERSPQVSPLFESLAVPHDVAKPPELTMLLVANELIAPSIVVGPLPCLLRARVAVVCKRLSHNLVNLLRCEISVEHSSKGPDSEPLQEFKLID